MCIRDSDYVVTISNDVENVESIYVLARDAEHAAWQALELSIQRNCKLIDVRLCDEW